MIFDEKYLSIKLNSSSSLLHNDPFDIVSKNGSIVPSLSVSTTQWTSIPKSTSSQSTPTKIVASLDQPSEVNDYSLTPCFP